MQCKLQLGCVAVKTAIDDLAQELTGDLQYFWLNSVIVSEELNRGGAVTNSCSIVVRQLFQMLARGLARNPTLSGDKTSWCRRLPDLAA